jgi:calcineurin-like phosphoesterase family protein
MIYPITYRHDESQKVFFFSDPHYCHEKLLESRGFSTIQEYNNTITRNWNTKVTNDDVVFMLGDLVLGAGKESRAVYENLLNILNYKILYVMMGNHGAGFHQIFKEHEEAHHIDKNYRLPIFSLAREIYFIPNYYEIFVNEQFIVLCHYPILSWNNIRHGSWMLFGHCHNNLEKTDWVKNNYLNTKCMDVGFEAVKAPISFSEVKEIMDKRPIIEVDHH